MQLAHLLHFRFCDLRQGHLLLINWQYCLLQHFMHTTVILLLLAVFIIPIVHVVNASQAAWVSWFHFSNPASTQSCDLPPHRLMPASTLHVALTHFIVHSIKSQFDFAFTLARHSTMHLHLLQSLCLSVRATLECHLRQETGYPLILPDRHCNW